MELESPSSRGTRPRRPAGGSKRRGRPAFVPECICARKTGLARLAGSGGYPQPVGTNACPHQTRPPPEEIKGEGRTPGFRVGKLGSRSVVISGCGGATIRVGCPGCKEPLRRKGFLALRSAAGSFPCLLWPPFAVCVFGTCLGEEPSCARA